MWFGGLEVVFLDFLLGGLLLLGFGLLFTLNFVVEHGEVSFWVGLWLLGCRWTFVLDGC